MVQCPYCYTFFTDSNECKTHAEEEHTEDLPEALGRDFYFKDYLLEETAFHKLKVIFRAKEEMPREEVEAMVRTELPVDAKEQRIKLLTLRLMVSTWPCKHELGPEDIDRDLSGCCDARRRFGEFMDIMCDAYDSSSDSE